MLQLLLLARLAAAQHADVRYQGPLFDFPSESKYVLGELGAHTVPIGDRFLWIYDARHLDVSEDPKFAVIDAAVTKDFAFDPSSATVALLEPGTVFYPTSALTVGESTHLFYAYTESSVYKGEGLAISSGADFARFTANGRYDFWDAGQPNFGLASVLGKDGWAYLYGAVHGKPGELKLARVKPESTGRPEEYEFYGGREWSKELAQAGDLFKDSPKEASVSYNEYLGAYLMLYGRYPQNDVVIRTAPEPWGPWSEPNPIHRCVLSDPKGSCAAVREQAAYAKEGGRKIYFTVNDPFRFFAGGRPELYEAVLDKDRRADKPGSVQLDVNYNYPATLFRIIESLSRSSRTDYLDFWKEQFGFGEKEKALLKEYARLREAYDMTISPGEEDASPMRRAGFNLGEKWPPLFAASESLEEAWSRADALLSPRDLDALKRIFAHFDARFRPYWDKHSTNLYHAVVAFDKDRWRLRISDYLSRVAGFYGLEPGLERRYTLSFIWHPPTTKSNVTHSERIGRVMLVELSEDVDLEDQLDVVVHELIHDLYAARPAALETRLDAALLKRDVNAGLFAVVGADEGLATALGQGLFIEENLPRRFSLKHPWYETAVDEYAKAAFPVIKKAFSQNQSLGTFNEEWIAALSPLAKEARLPAIFGHHQLLTDAKTAGLSRPLWEAVEVRSAFGGSLGDKEDEARFAARLKAHWAEPVIVMLEPESLDDKVAGWLDWDLDPGMVQLLKRKASKTAVITTARSRRGRPYLLLLGAKDALEPRLAGLKEMRP